MSATDRNSLGARLRDERLRLGLSQDDMCAIGEVSKRTQAAWEKGEQVPHAAYLALICAAGADLLYIVTGQRMVMAQSQGMGAALAAEEAELVDHYRDTDADGRATARRMLRALAAESRAAKRSG